MWTAVSGAVARAQAVDTVANNLANQDTLGFKKDAPTFREYVSRYEREPAAVGPKVGPITDKDLYQHEGRDQSYVITDGNYTDYRQGHLKVTHSPMDLAIDGNGFFEVSTPQGTRYTRQGSLKMAMDGRLVTNEGYPVLAAQPGGLAGADGQGRPETQGGVAARFINLRDRGAISVSESGEIYAGGDLVAKLSVTEFADPNKLRKVGGTLFENREDSNRLPDLKRTVVRQGAIESSNVNPIEEMSNLIKANRLYEHDLKVMGAYNDMMGKVSTEVGKL